MTFYTEKLRERVNVIAGTNKAYGVFASTRVNSSRTY